MTIHEMKIMFAGIIGLGIAVGIVIAIIYIIKWLV